MVTLNPTRSAVGGSLPGGPAIAGACPESAGPASCSFCLPQVPHWSHAKHQHLFASQFRRPDLSHLGLSVLSATVGHSDILAGAMDHPMLWGTRGKFPSSFLEASLTGL